MNRYNHHHKIMKRDYVIRIAFIVVTVGLLFAFCPRANYSQLKYELGAPWEGDDFIAKDSFVVQKSSAMVEIEKKEEIKRLYIPRYQLNVLTKNQQLEELNNDLLNSHANEELPSYMIEEIKKILIEKYKMGILPDSSYRNAQKLGINKIGICQGTEEIQVKLDEINLESKIREELLLRIQGAFQNAKDMLQRYGINLNKYVVPNLSYDANVNTIKMEEVLRGVTAFSGRVRPGEKIVSKGQLVTQEIYDKLESYQKYIKENNAGNEKSFVPAGGQLIYITLLVLGLFMYFYHFRKDYLHRLRRSVFIWLLVVIFPLLAYIITRNEWATPYIIPFCMVPIFIRVFYDSRTAFITHLTCAMLAAITTNEPFEFISVQIMAGLTAIYMLKQLQQRSELFFAVAIVTVISALTHLCLDMINMNFTNELKHVDSTTYIYIATNGGLLLLTYLLLVPIEKVFHFTSTVTLVELSNINNPILRALSEKAPGTFQHSMQVANLSAEVANRLGANAQLVRTGAMYHDIGKLKQPVFFTENQNGMNPHNQLPFEDSAQIIIQHVKNGLELANKHHLPQSIKTFISSHHGRSKTKFFYISYINQNPDKQVNDEIFTYPGPNPSSIEEAILMMADSVEAASRSLPEYTEESITTLVNRIVDSQVKEGYFNHCPITFDNIETCKQVFIEKLKTIYHTRVSYPELRKPKAETQSTSK